MAAVGSSCSTHCGLGCSINRRRPCSTSPPRRRSTGFLSSAAGPHPDTRGVTPERKTRTANRRDGQAARALVISQIHTLDRHPISHPQRERSLMPFVNVKLVEGCLHRRPETRYGRGPDRGDSQARGLQSVVWVLSRSCTRWLAHRRGPVPGAEVPDGGHDRAGLKPHVLSPRSLSSWWMPRCEW
jgi:hypothetical protein